MSIQIEPIDYRLHEAFYGNYYDTHASKKDLSLSSPLTDPDIWPDIETLKNKEARKEAIKEIALFILAGALFFIGGAALLLGSALLITSGIPGLPILMGGALLFLTSLIIFYNLFKGSEEPIKSV